MIHAPADVAIAAAIARQFELEPVQQVRLALNHELVTSHRDGHRKAYLSARGWVESQVHPGYLVKPGVTNEYGTELLTLDEAYWMEQAED